MESVTNKPTVHKYSTYHKLCMTNHLSSKIRLVNPTSNFYKNDTGIGIFFPTKSAVQDLANGLGESVYNGMLGTFPYFLSMPVPPHLQVQQHVHTSSGTFSFSQSETWCTGCPASSRYGPPFPPNPAVSLPPVPPAQVFPPT